MYNFDFKKTLGQNFLKDDNIVNKIVNATEYKKNNLVIEIGPGAGSLTKKLLPKVDKAILYEIDTRLERILNKELAEYDNYTIIFDDFLNRNVNDDLSNYCFDNLYIVANLPYYITTPIISKIIEEKIPACEIVIMIQKEVADRYSAKVNTKEYGYFTLFLNFYYEVNNEIFVGKNNFDPIPKVDSEVISLYLKEEVPNINVEKYFSFLKECFSHKRKTLKNNIISYDYEKIMNVLNKYGLTESVRAEQISEDIFIEIFKSLEC